MAPLLKYGVTQKEVSCGLGDNFPRDEGEAEGEDTDNLEPAL